MLLVFEKIVKFIKMSIKSPRRCLFFAKEGICKIMLKYHFSINSLISCMRIEMSPLKLLVRISKSLWGSAEKNIRYLFRKSSENLAKISEIICEGAVISFKSFSLNLSISLSLLAILNLISPANFGSLGSS